jgi:hypothetical protein
MFEVIFSDEAIEQRESLDPASKKKIIKAIRNFSGLGLQARNSRNLGEIWEIKADNVRAYFDYEGNKIIIVGLIVLKKSQEAPKRFIEQAKRNIDRVRLMMKKGAI